MFISTIKLCCHCIAGACTFQDLSSKYFILTLARQIGEVFDFLLYKKYFFCNDSTIFYKNVLNL